MTPSRNKKKLKKERTYEPGSKQWFAQLYSSQAKKSLKLVPQDRSDLAMRRTSQTNETNQVTTTSDSSRGLQRITTMRAVEMQKETKYIKRVNDFHSNSINHVKSAFGNFYSSTKLLLSPTKQYKNLVNPKKLGTNKDKQEQKKVSRTSETSKDD